MATKKDPCLDCRFVTGEAAEHVDGKPLACLHCGKLVSHDRVYFGVAGPFCCVPCRDRYQPETES